MVNRVWHHLFGSGLVKTVDNFGVNGDSPSHPELLDHLATRFIRDGWSIKRLVRSIVLTRAYRLSSSAASGEPGESIPTTGSSGVTVRAGSTRKKFAMRRWPPPVSWICPAPSARRPWICR